MAKTFYDYEKRADLGSYVDWAAIGKTVSDGLIKVSADRQAKRDELDKITNESITTINELAVGQPQSSSEFYMDGANNIKEALGLSYREMKAGRLSPNEYLKQRQNIMDDLGQMQAAANSFKTDWEAMSKRLENSASPTGAAEQEIYQNELLDSFGITKDKAIYVNPVDNRIYIATRDANGKVIKDPSKLLPISHLTSLRKDQVNKYDVVGEVNKRVKTLGDVTRSVMSGRVMTLNDAVQRPEYMKAENDMISSMMTSPRATGTILTNYVGGYGVTESKEVADKDPNKILLVKDSNGLLHPKLTREQEDVAREALRAQIRVQLKSTETPMPVQRQQEWEANRADAREEVVQNVGMWHSLAFGTASQQSTAANQLLGSQMAKGLGLVAITPSGSSYKLTYSGSGSMAAGTRELNAAGKTAAEWGAIGNELHGVDDVNKALRASGVSNPNQVYSGTMEGSAERVNTPSPLKEFPGFVSSGLASIDDSEFTGDDESAVKDKLITAIGGLGFKVTSGMAQDSVTITAPAIDGKPGGSMTFSVDNAEGNVNNRQAIIEFVTTNTSLTDIAKLSKAGRLSAKGELD